MTKTRKVFLCLMAISMMVLLSSCAGAPKWDLPSAFNKGMVSGKWGDDALASNDFRETLKDLKKRSGINCVQIDAVEYQESVTSTNISLLTHSRNHANYKRILEEEQRRSDKVLSKKIKEVRNLGLKVLLVPKIDIIDKADGMYGRSDIGFTSEAEWNEWFSEYQEFILHYAKLARKCKVHIFCVGAGLSFTLDRTDKWNELILAVKGVYKGEIFYAANKDTYGMMGEWDGLDYLGINMNYPIVHSSKPTLDEIRQGLWKWSDSIEDWSPAINKNIIFVEVGRDGVVEGSAI